MKQEKSKKHLLRGNYLSPEIKFITIDATEILCLSNTERMTRSEGEWDEDEEDESEL